MSYPYRERSPLGGHRDQDRYQSDRRTEDYGSRYSTDRQQSTTNQGRASLSDLYPDLYTSGGRQSQDLRSSGYQDRYERQSVDRSNYQDARRTPDRSAGYQDERQSLDTAYQGTGDRQSLYDRSGYQDSYRNDTQTIDRSDYQGSLQTDAHSHDRLSYQDPQQTGTQSLDRPSYQDAYRNDNQTQDRSGYLLDTSRADSQSLDRSDRSAYQDQYPSATQTQGRSDYQDAYQTDTQSHDRSSYQDQLQTDTRNLDRPSYQDPLQTDTLDRSAYQDSYRSDSQSLDRSDRSAYQDSYQNDNLTQGRSDYQGTLGADTRSQERSAYQDTYRNDTLDHGRSDRSAYDTVNPDRSAYQGSHQGTDQYDRHSSGRSEEFQGPYNQSTDNTSAYQNTYSNERQSMDRSSNYQDTFYNDGRNPEQSIYDKDNFRNDRESIDRSSAYQDTYQDETRYPDRSGNESRDQSQTYQDGRSFEASAGGYGHNQTTEMETYNKSSDYQDRYHGDRDQSSNYHDPPNRQMYDRADDYGDSPNSKRPRLDTSSRQYHDSYQNDGNRSEQSADYQGTWGTNRQEPSRSFQDKFPANSQSKFPTSSQGKFQNDRKSLEQSDNYHPANQSRMQSQAQSLNDQKDRQSMKPSSGYHQDLHKKDGGAQQGKNQKVQPADNKQKAPAPAADQQAKQQTQPEEPKGGKHTVTIPVMVNRYTMQFTHDKGNKLKRQFIRKYFQMFDDNVSIRRKNEKDGIRGYLFFLTKELAEKAFQGGDLVTDGSETVSYHFIGGVDKVTLSHCPQEESEIAKDQPTGIKAIKLKKSVGNLGPLHERYTMNYVHNRDGGYIKNKMICEYFRQFDPLMTLQRKGVKDVIYGYVLFQTKELADKAFAAGQVHMGDTGKVSDHSVQGFRGNVIVSISHCAENPFLPKEEIKKAKNALKEQYNTGGPPSKKHAGMPQNLPKDRITTGRPVSHQGTSQILPHKHHTAGGPVPLIHQGPSHVPPSHHGPPHVPLGHQGPPHFPLSHRGPPPVPLSHHQSPHVPRQEHYTAGGPASLGHQGPMQDPMEEQYTGEDSDLEDDEDSSQEDFEDDDTAEGSESWSYTGTAQYKEFPMTLTYFDDNINKDHIYAHFRKFDPKIKLKTGRIKVGGFIFFSSRELAERAYKAGEMQVDPVSQEKVSKHRVNGNQAVGIANCWDPLTSKYKKTTDEQVKQQIFLNKFLAEQKAAEEGFDNKAILDQKKPLPDIPHGPKGWRLRLAHLKNVSSDTLKTYFGQFGQVKIERKGKSSMGRMLFPTKEEAERAYFAGVECIQGVNRFSRHRIDGIYIITVEILPEGGWPKGQGRGFSSVNKSRSRRRKKNKKK